MTEAIKLDVHAHLIPVLEERLSEMEGVDWDGAAEAMNIDGHKVAIKPIFRPDALRRWMDENNVAHAFVSAPPPLYRQHLRGTASRAWADYINDGLWGVAANSNGRISALIHLPTEDPDVALDVAREHLRRGHRLFAMPAGTGDDRTLGMEIFERLWVVLDAAKAFVFFHPGECGDGRLKSFYLTNLLGNPYESTVALGHLVFAGVLERYPNMTPCFAHGGGLLPMVAGRFQRGYETARPGLDTTRAAPSHVIPRIYVDCICHDEAASALSEATFGEDQVVFGSDWPFPMGLVEPHSQLEAYEPERRKRYFQTNPGSLLSCLEVKE
ncbi:amidohydrolase family protein [Ensifer sp. ENS05]|uniref:amidohydrolase family protein n=1 Tax=Ensifer sp. ENS05 TaxID=2769277 RepID=UPI001782FD9C|nr:amidohydrolase family protein [Ensifer sp. ENS05]MBD9597415.1 amidohydrolase family protein [Ensifer sp. ENS05]